MERVDPPKGSRPAQPEASSLRQATRAESQTRISPTPAPRGDDRSLRIKSLQTTKIDEIK